MATQLTLNDGSLNSAGALKIKTNGTTEAVDISTGQVVTLAKDAVVNGLTVGKGAGAVSTNTAVGASALAATASGSNVVAVGYQAGTAVTSADNSVFVGAQAGLGSTTCTGVTAVGSAALYANTSGSYNVGIGQQALRFNTTASNNTAVGYQAGYSNTTGANNALFGYQCGYSLTTGTFNTFIGQQAAYYVTTGSRNTVIGTYNGNQGGLDIRTASNYIVLSDGDGNPMAYCANAGTWRFGLGGTTSDKQGTIQLNGASGSNLGWYIDGLNNGTRTNIIGNYSQINGGTATWLTLMNTGGGVYLNGASATSWTAVSDETRKVIIEPIADAANKVATLRTVIGRLKSDDETVRRPYLIAQDVQAVLPEAVSELEDREGLHLGLSYTEVIPLLVAAIKELKAEIDILKGQA